MERKFYSFAEIFSSLVRVSSGVKAGAYLQSSHIFTYQKTREFYLSAYFNTFFQTEVSWEYIVERE